MRIAYEWREQQRVVDDEQTELQERDAQRTYSRNAAAAANSATAAPREHSVAATTGGQFGRRWQSAGAAVATHGSRRIARSDVGRVGVRSQSARRGGRRLATYREAEAREQLDALADGGLRIPRQERREQQRWQRLRWRV